MFDKLTESLISSAPPLDGLDMEGLPELLSEAYLQVVSARLGSIQVALGRADESWQKTLLDLRRLAETYEGLTIFLPEEDSHRRSCAYVAASAYHTLQKARLAEQLASGELPAEYPSITTHGIAPEVSACLLYLVAGSQADAAEAARSFTLPDDSPGASELLTGIAAFASGDGTVLQRFAEGASHPSNTDIATPASESLGQDYVETVGQLLWLKLLSAVRAGARSALGDLESNPVGSVDQVIRKIEAAQSTVEVDEARLVVRLPLEGLYHLARLLKPALAALESVAVARLTPPTEVSSVGWMACLRHFASRRPFLWNNHIAAIESLILEPGQSFILTFPTGAGKSTLAELRIAVEVLRHRNVVYLVPTRALVDQVSTELRSSLHSLAGDVVRGRFLEDFGEQSGARVLVQTPEQCLSYLSCDKDSHHDIGLLIVDECHLLSGSVLGEAGEIKPTPRRSIDAMWTVLTLISRSPGLDVILISAMVRNGEQLANWLSAATGRPARVLDLPWKPTRQVRGIVAYGAEEISGLRELLNERRNSGRRKYPGKVDLVGVQARPLGVFCHSQVWRDDASYTEIPLLSHPVRLGVNKYWGLTANRNEIAGILAGAMAQVGIRPLVFTQKVDWTSRIAQVAMLYLQDRGVASVGSTPHETELLSAAATELGSPEFVESAVGGVIGVHHGSLLPQERLAVEAAFRRPDGLRALVATPTVAQGMNLPAEAVLIAGDDRWEGDAEQGRAEVLAAHELLNAAGRAGRAGHFACGIVVDLPGRVHVLEHVEDGAIDYNDLIEHAMGLLGLPDQCIDVVDPITQVLDVVARQGAADDGSRYLIRRAAGLDAATLQTVLHATLGNAAREDREEIVNVQRTVIGDAADALAQENHDTQEWAEVAAQFGVSSAAMATVALQVPDVEEFSRQSFPELQRLALSILLSVRGGLFGLVDAATSGLDSMLPRAGNNEEILVWEERVRNALEEVVPLWLEGTPICVIGETLHRVRGADGRVKAIALGRRFALRTSSSIGYAVSMICEVFRVRYGDRIPPHIESWLRLLPGCFREGFNSPDALLTFWNLRRFPGLYPRVPVHTYFPRIADTLPDWEAHADIDVRRRFIARAVTEHGLPGSD